MADDSQNPSPAAGASQGQSGNFFLDNFGAGDAGQGASAAQAAQAQRAEPQAGQQPPAQPQQTGNFFTDNFGPGEQPQPEAPPPKPKPHEWAFAKGFAGESLHSLSGMLSVLSQSGEGLSMEADPEHAGVGDQAAQIFNQQFIDPVRAEAAKMDLPADAPFIDQAMHGLGATASFIAQAVLTGGGAMYKAAAERLGGGLAARAAGGAASVTVPAVSDAIETGNTVSKATGDPKVGAVAAAVKYLTNAGSAAIPLGIGGSIFTRLITAATAGIGMQEGSRAAMNTVLPENMQQPFDVKSDLLAAVTTAPFAFLPHGGPEVGRQVVAQRETVMEHAEKAAADAVKASGGDALDQTKAAVSVSAEVGAHHDAAAVQGARDEEDAAQVRALQMHDYRQAQAADEEASQAPVEAKAQKDQQVEAAYSEQQRQQGAQKDQDYTAALNQRGDQEVQGAALADVGAEKGGANEPAPTLADALPPEQLSALQKLREQRMGAQPPAKSIGEQVAPEVQPLPPLQAAKARAAEAAPPGRAPTEAQEPTSEAALPESGPPPVKATDLAARRQAALDEAMAAKLRRPPLRQGGEDTAEPLYEAQVKEDAERAARAVGQEAPNEAANAVPTPPPNRLEVIRRAAEARRAALPEAAQGIIADLRAGRRTPPQGRVENNASGESAASLEAINRGSRDLDLVRPDGTSEPVMRGVDQVDRQAPDGHLIVDRSTGEVVSRGKDLNALQANGLKNRYLAQRTPAQASAAPMTTHEAAGPERGELADASRRFAESVGRPTAESAKARLGDKIARLGDAAKDVVIHDSPYDEGVPQHRIDEFLAHGVDPTTIKGWYSPSEDNIRIFANAHDDHKDLETTLVHELAHLGVTRATGGRNAIYTSTMNRIFKTNEGAQKWMQYYSTKVMPGLDMDNPSHRAYVMDEYAAHLAESPWKDRTAWQNIVQAVRNSMRAMGIGHFMKWTDEDVRDLILRGNKSQSAVRNALGYTAARDDASLPQASLRGQDEEKLTELGSLHPDDHAVAQGSRLAMTKEAQANYRPNPGQRTQDLLDKLGNWGLPKLLSTIDTRHLPDFVNPEKMPAVQKWIQQNDLRRGRVGALQKDGFDTLKAWSKWADKNPDDNATLGTIMHASTIVGVDPSKDYVPRWSPEETAADPAKAAAEASRQSMHTRLQGLYEGLDGTGQKLYNDVRDLYTNHRNATWNALEARINETGADDNTKKQVLAQLRRQFEASTVAGPYFPLFRTGDLWARAKDGDGNHVAFSRFESQGERRQWAANMQEKGFDVEQGKLDNNKSLMERIDPDFVRQIMDVTKDSPQLQDEIWQTYLRAMPEMSMRKNFIHRQGRLGFSADAMRAFSFNMQHGAMQIARLEYGNRLDTIVNDAKAQAATMQAEQPGTYEAEKASAVAGELGKRNDWVKNPQNSPWTNAVNQAGFMWYLGMAPATAFRIHSQNSMLASPILAAKFGQMGTWREMGKAVTQWAKSRGNLGDTLRGDERQAFDEAGQQGMFSNTWASTLAQAAQDSPVTGAWANFRNISQWMFNAIEHKNRMTTYLAAYRLGRQSGMEHDEAVQTANKMTWDAHLDYGNDNRARFLQNDFMKVAGQFKQYPLGVMYRLARDFRDSLPSILKNNDITPEQRTQAQKQFAGLLVRSFMWSGATGLPMAWAAEAACNSIFGDKDKPFDSREAVHSYLQEEMGRTAADAVMYGPMSATTGAALSSGASYSDLLYKTPSKWNEMTPAERMSDGVQQALGPAFGAIYNGLIGVPLIEQHPELALEHFMPPAAQGPLKAYRYATQGVRNLQNEEVMSPEELGDGWSKAMGVSPEAIRDKNLFLQSLGFTPQNVADRRQMNSAMKGAQEQIMARKNELESNYYTALQNGDDEEQQKALSAIDKFREAHPNMGFNVGRGVLSRRRNEAKSTHGVLLNKGLRSELQQQYGGGEEQQ